MTGTDQTSTIQLGADADTSDRVLSPIEAATVEALPRGNGMLVVQRCPGAGSRFLLDQDTHVDAMNMDLKSMDPAFYRKTCGGDLPAVLGTVRAAAKRTHVELTNLLYTGHNDSDDAIRRVVDFVAETDPEIPLHFSRYFQQHRATAPPTPPDRLLPAYRLAREHLPYAYVGNFHLPGGADTKCPKCGATAVARDGYRVDARGLARDRCAACGARLRFVV